MTKLTCMQNQCPVCHEALFNEHGIAEKDVAKIDGCLHIVHSDCLASNCCGDSGILTCPICDQHVHLWMSLNQAADFPAFWVDKILKCLQTVGPSGGAISVHGIKRKLLKTFTLSSRQQKHLLRNSDRCLKDDGFLGALRLNDELWHFDEEKKSVWLNEWGSSPVTN